MGDLRFNGLVYLHLLWLVPALVVFYYAAFRSKRKALQLFADGVAQLLRYRFTHRFLSYRSVRCGGLGSCQLRQVSKRRET